MEHVFYAAGIVAVLATIMALTRFNAVHALLYLIVSLLAVAVVFYTLGAAFMAMLEVMVYAGAIMVLFIFVVMMLNLGERAVREERALLGPNAWVGPSILAAVLIVEVVYLLTRGTGEQMVAFMDAKHVGMALYGPYVIGVELASFLLTAGLVGAYHLGWRQETRDVTDTSEGRLDAGGHPVRVGDGRTAGTAQPDLRIDVH